MEAQQQQEGHHRRARSITSLQRFHDSNRGPTVLNVLVSAYQVRWRTVEERLTTHPEEASILDSGGCSVLYRALTRRIDDYPPVRIVRKIVEAHPNVVWERYDTTTLLELACWRRASLETLEVLTAARPAIPEDASVLSALWKAHCEFHGSEDGFVQFLQSGSAEAFMVGCKFQLLLRYLTTRQLLPLTMERALASPHCSLELFEMICETLQKSSPQQYSVSKAGICRSSVGLHSLLRTCLTSSRTNEELILLSNKLEYLLSNEFWRSMGLEQTDSNGKLPLHLALEQGIVNENLLRVLSNNFDERLLAVTDPFSGMLPCQKAATCGASESTIFQLFGPVSHLLEDHPTSSSTRIVTQAKSDNDATCIHEVTEETNNEPRWISPVLEQLIQQVDGNMHSQLAKALTSNASDPTWNQMVGAAKVFQCPLRLLELLITLHPEMLQEADRNGWLPLHHAIVSQHADDHTIITKIINACPEACHHRDATGRLPLHLACCSSKGMWLLERLLTHCPGALEEVDSVLGLPPALLTAQCQQSPLSNVFYLLTRMPDVMMKVDDKSTDIS